MPAPSRIMSGPPEPSLRRVPYLSKMAPSSAQRAASCSLVGCAWAADARCSSKQQSGRGQPHRQFSNGSYRRRHYTCQLAARYCRGPGRPPVKGGENMISRCDRFDGWLSSAWLFLPPACADRQEHAGQRSQLATPTPRWSPGPTASRPSRSPAACRAAARAAPWRCARANYTMLNMENMPTRGDASVVRGTGTVVVRCAGRLDA